MFLFSLDVSAYVYGYCLPIHFQLVEVSPPMFNGIQLMAILLPKIATIILTGAMKQDGDTTKTA